MAKWYKLNYNRFKICQLEDPSHVKEIISIGVKQFLRIQPGSPDQILDNKYENQGNCSPEMMEFLISCKILITGENKRKNE